MGIQNIELLENSFQLLAPQGQTIVEKFYQNLFADYPDVKPMFEDVDMNTQKSKLLASLALVVGNLRTPEQLVPALEQMGQRHVGYGAVEEHYPAVAATMIKTLAEVAGDVWTDELEKAWSNALGEVAKIMLNGAAMAVSS